MGGNDGGMLDGLELDEEKFLSLLRKLIGETEHLQNNPPALIPTEDRAVQHVTEVLGPLSVENGGPLILKHVSYVEGRGNLIVEYPGTLDGKVVSFVGSHLDVVTANPNDWKYDPFALTVEGDMLIGRGTTDCLGHVALITDLFRQLGTKKPLLKSKVVAVFIANEETSATLGVGVDALVKDHYLDELKAGPVFWIDVADKHPCIGTGGMLVWTLKGVGKLFHSGLPHKAINAMELIMEALRVIQDKFYIDFPPHEKEEIYGFATPSTMKPTQWGGPAGGVNQIPGECFICGDCRVTPFYSVLDVKNKIQGYVDDINKNIDKLATRGPVSKYSLPAEGLTGRLEIHFDPIMTSGIACDLNSPGFHALCSATEKVLGFCKPYSITGSLPLVRELQDEGFDLQTTGYGKMDAYHANNEFCLLSDFKQGFQILAGLITKLEG